VRVHCVHH